MASDHRPFLRPRKDAPAPHNFAQQALKTSRIGRTRHRHGRRFPPERLASPLIFYTNVKIRQHIPRRPQKAAAVVFRHHSFPNCPRQTFCKKTYSTKKQEQDHIPARKISFLLIFLLSDRKKIHHQYFLFYILYQYIIYISTGIVEKKLFVSSPFVTPSCKFEKFTTFRSIT